MEYQIYKTIIIKDMHFQEGSELPVFGTIAARFRSGAILPLLISAC
jgi:hypothetical protein